MKIVVAVHGTRGDVEPAAAVACEMQARGHSVHVAVPPNLVAFARSAGLAPVTAYGPDSALQLQAEVFRRWWTLRNPAKVLRQARDYVTEGWAEMGDTLHALACDADLILCGTTYQELAANVAEAHGIPLAALHYFPCRANTQVLPVRLPAAVVKPLWSLVERAHWHLSRPASDAQRRRLSLPRSTIPAIRRMVDGGALEIQAYDPVLFPGLDAEWSGTRPIVGALTLDLPTADDDAVLSWIEQGNPPIFFGFGSMPIAEAGETLAMITGLCRSLGERCLICSGSLAATNPPLPPGTMVVPALDYSRIFPRCRAIVHHGGSGTTATGLRSGVPTVVLWIGADQPLWASRVRRLGVGTARRFSSSTATTLRDDLHTALSPRCIARAREVAARMTRPRDSVTRTADLLEAFATRPAPC